MAAAAPSIKVGDTMIYVDCGVEKEVTVIQRDDTITPPSFVIKMPDGRERDTEASRLSRPKKRQASPSAAETVSMGIGEH